MLTFAEGDSRNDARDCVAPWGCLRACSHAYPCADGQVCKCATRKCARPQVEQSVQRRSLATCLSGAYIRLVWAVMKVPFSCSRRHLVFLGSGSFCATWARTTPSCHQQLETAVAQLGSKTVLGATKSTQPLTPLSWDQGKCELASKSCKQRRGGVKHRKNKQPPSGMWMLSEFLRKL